MRTVLMSAVILMLMSFFLAIESVQEHHSAIQIAQLEYTTVSDVKWSSDGARLAIVAFPSIHIVDTTTWDTVLVIPDANVSQVVWSPDSTRIASVQGGYNESLLIWDATTGELLERFERYDENIGNGYLGIYWSTPNF